MNKWQKENFVSIDFYLSKSCNKTCHYCTAWTKEMRFLHVDLNFLNRVLEYLSPYKVKINLLGGEPGLIKNLDSVIKAIKKYDNFMPSILSNSFIRKRYPYILEDPTIRYEEHLVLDFHENHIEKLGNFEFFEKNSNNNYNIIIQTPNYFKYRENFDLSILDHENTIFKKYNSRSPTYDIIEQAAEIDRKLCSKFPSVPVVDFEIQKIRHCSKKVINGSRQFDITKENVDKMMNFNLFEYEDYCRTCTEYISPYNNIRAVKILDMLNNNV